MKPINISIMIFVLILGHRALGQNESIRLKGTSSSLFSSEFEKQILQNYGETQQTDPLLLIMASSTTIDEHKINEYVADYDSFVQLLQKRQAKYKNQVDFLNYLFYKVHRKYLKNYENFTEFFDLVENGDYDCVVGTAFYSILLTDLGFDHVINETDYHVFLTINTSKQKVIFESTNPLNGFITDPKEIKKHNEFYTSYQQQSGNLASQVASQDKNLHFSYNIKEQIGIYEIVGLQYFNQAARAYNQFQFKEALNHLTKAKIFYNCQRVNDFIRLVHQSMHMSLEAKNF
ncbi:MAG: hypothetical protein ACNS62_00180 [Candidatus Cyclobacteriaceae bacterium M3_2C_046]